MDACRRIGAPSSGMAIAFQAVRLFRGMTVLENVMVGGHAWTRPRLRRGVPASASATAARSARSLEAAQEALAAGGSRSIGRHAGRVVADRPAARRAGGAGAVRSAASCCCSTSRRLGLRVGRTRATGWVAGDAAGRRAVDAAGGARRGVRHPTGRAHHGDGSRQGHRRRAPRRECGAIRWSIGAYLGQERERTRACLRSGSGRAVRPGDGARRRSACGSNAARWWR